MILLRTANNRLARCNPNTVITSGSVNIDNVEITLDESWQGLGEAVEYYLSFEKMGGDESEKFAVKLSDNGEALICSLPLEVTSSVGSWEIGLFAKNSNGDKIKTSTLLSLSVERGANPNLTADPELTMPEWYELYEITINKMHDFYKDYRVEILPPDDEEIPIPEEAE